MRGISNSTDKRIAGEDQPLGLTSYLPTHTEIVIIIMFKFIFMVDMLQPLFISWKKESCLNFIEYIYNHGIIQQTKTAKSKHCFFFPGMRIKNASGAMAQRRTS